MNADCVIVDANIAFKCLHSGRGDLRERIGPGGHPKFFSPRFLFVELFKHKERLERASGLAETDLLAGLDALLARDSESRAEFGRLQADARTAKAALPLVDATQATAGEFPAFARGRLQTKVRQTLGGPAVQKEPDRSLALGWRWVLGLAATAAVVLLVALPIFRTPNAPVIQVAMLDTAGAVRGFGYE